MAPVPRARPTGPRPRRPAPAEPQPVALLSEKEQRDARACCGPCATTSPRNAENVGERFADEARRMHYGEIEHRSIYGRPTRPTPGRSSTRGSRCTDAPAAGRSQLSRGGLLHQRHAFRRPARPAHRQAAVPDPRGARRGADRALERGGRARRTRSGISATSPCTSRPERIDELLGRLNGTQAPDHRQQRRPGDPRGGRAGRASRPMRSCTSTASALVLCHYAFRTWKNMGRGWIDLHGHSHGKLKPQTRQVRCRRRRLGLPARDAGDDPRGAAGPAGK